MKNEKLREKLARVGELVGGASELERDLALELLREIYSEIKFSESEPAAEGKSEGFNPRWKENSLLSLPSVKTDGCAQVSSPSSPSSPSSTPPVPAVIDETVLEGEDCQMPEPEVTTPSVAEATDTPPQEGNREPETEPDPEPEPEVETEPEPAIIPRRVDPKVIRSLYGTEDEDEDHKPGSPSVEGWHGVPGRSATTAETAATETTPPVAPKTETVPQTTHANPAPTLGDALNAGHKTLGESLKGGNGEKDMASHIAAAGQPGLKKSIGLNDRFLMIRDLFDGDAAAFDEAVARLDTFTDLDSAVIHIHDNYDWNADSEGAKRLVELLERKLA